MSEIQVRVEKTGTETKTGAENENQVRVGKVPPPDGGWKNRYSADGHRKKLKTHCYYTDYVNHAIRFYLTTPDTLRMEGKRRADVDNWMAVQAVFHCLRNEDRKTLEEIYRSNYRVDVGVKLYCEKTGTDEEMVWILITKTSAAIAKRRGLV